MSQRSLGLQNGKKSWELNLWTINAAVFIGAQRLTWITRASLFFKFFFLSDFFLFSAVSLHLLGNQNFKHLNKYIKWSTVSKVCLHYQLKLDFVNLLNILDSLITKTTDIFEELFPPFISPDWSNSLLQGSWEIKSSAVKALFNIL